jgi:hypothetical protein
MGQDLLCRDCGQPKHESYNPDSEGWYSVHDETCNACTALRLDMDANEKAPLERKVFVHDDRPPDKPLRPWTPGA